MDGKYDTIVGGNIHRQGSPKTLTPHVALRLLQVIVRSGGGSKNCQPKRRLDVRLTTASTRPKAKALPKVGRQRLKTKATAKARTLAKKALDNKRQRAAIAKAPAVRVTHGGRSLKNAKVSFELGPPGPDPQTRQAPKLSVPAPRNASQPASQPKPTA